MRKVTKNVTSEKKKSESARAFAEDGACKTHVGGQALMEGVMMRGRYNWAVAVREPSGDIYLEEHDLASGKEKNGWLYWPFVRGCRAFVESLMLGFQALEIAALHAFGEEEEEGSAKDEGHQGLSADQSGERFAEPVDDRPADQPAEERPFSWKEDFGRPDTVIDALGAQRTLEVVAEPDAPLADEQAVAKQSAAKASEEDEQVEFGHREMVFSMVLGLVLGVVLFVVAPAFVTNLIVGEYDENTLAWNIVDGVIRVGVFVFYIWLIGRMQEIKRMFSYHGAEHKTIHCYEHGLPLTVENARSFPRLHVRCGTAFLIMVMLIAIVVYTVVPLDKVILALGVPDGAVKLVLVIMVRIALMPVIAGISYEITVKWAGSHPENPLVKVILWPGMQMQRLTTKEPDDGMLECAIASMKAVLEREDAEAARLEEPAAA